MGIKNLNRFLKDNCTKKAIRKIKLEHLHGKVIAVDASIYMYRYQTENALIEQMYMLLSTLLSNGIIPVFIFDGKPPDDKLELIKKRRMEKKTAELKYNDISNKLEINKDIITIEAKNELLNELSRLKQQFVRLHSNDILQVKTLLTAYGVMYYESYNEADEVCAYLVKSGKAWGCLSDDMDMFIYNCPNVIRNISLLNGTVLLYETEQILKELCMTHNEFKEIMVLSGTDYNINNNCNLDSTIELYSKYRDSTDSNKTNEIGFYNWLLKTTNYIKDYDELIHVCTIFNMNSLNTDELDKLEISTNNIDNELLQNIMAEHGFIFTSTSK